MGFFFNYLSGFGFRELLIFDFSYFWMLDSCVNFDILIWLYFVIILIFCLISVCLLFFPLFVFCFFLSVFCFLCLFSSFCLLFFSIRLLFSLFCFFVVMMLIINWFWEMSDFCLFYCLLLFFLVLGISYFFF